MVNEAHRLDVKITAHDNASLVLNKISGRLGATTKAGLAMGVAMAGVTIAMSAAMGAVQSLNQWIGESVKKYREFEQAMSEVASMMDKTGKELLPAMIISIEILSTKMGKSVIDLSRGLYQVLSAGIDASRAIQVLSQSSRLATATLTSVETAVDAVTTVLNAYGMEANQVYRVTDIMAETIKQGKLRMDELANSLGYVVPIAAQAGISFEEVTAAIAALTKQGISAQKATRGLRQVFSTLVAPSEEAVSVMAELGLYYDDLTLRVEGFYGTVMRINDATRGNIAVTNELIGNVQALSTFLGVSAQDGGIFKSTLDSITESMGALNTMYDEIADTSAFAKLQQEQMGEAIDRGVGKAAEGADRKIGNVINIFKSWIAHGTSMADVIKETEINSATAYGEEVINAAREEAGRFAGELENIHKNIAQMESDYDEMIDRTAIYRGEITKLESHKAILVMTKEWKEDLTNISFALKDSAYSSRIWDSSLLAIINRIRENKEELEELQNVYDTYNNVIRANSVQVMQIQLAGMNRRRGNTRSEKKMLKEIRKEDLQNRISMTQNQMSMDVIKRGALATDEKLLEKKKMQYQISITDTENALQSEIDKITDQITVKQGLIDTFEELRADAQAKIDKAKIDEITAWNTVEQELIKAGKADIYKIILGETAAWRLQDQNKIDSAVNMANRVIEAKRAAAEGQWRESQPKNWYKYSFGGPLDILSDIGSAIWGAITGKKASAIRPGYQSRQGGDPYVAQTGLYQLHQGERVVPKHQNTGGGHGSNINVNIRMNAIIKNETSIENLGSRIGQAIAAGFVSGADSEFVIG